MISEVVLLWGGKGGRESGEKDGRLSSEDNRRDSLSVRHSRRGIEDLDANETRGFAASIAQRRHEWRRCFAHLCGGSEATWWSRPLRTLRGPNANAHDESVARTRLSARSGLSRDRCREDAKHEESNQNLLLACTHLHAWPRVFQKWAEYPSHIAKARGTGERIASTSSGLRLQRPH